MKTAKCVMLEPLSRTTLETFVTILGPHCAAAAALADAATHDGPVSFWKSGNAIVVEKCQPTSESANRRSASVLP